jgi:DNA-binding FadR family transcriptional regulator
MGQRGVTEHVALVEAIRARDADAARDIMLEHLSRTAKRLGLSVDGDIWQTGSRPHA